MVTQMMPGEVLSIQTRLGKSSCNLVGEHPSLPRSRRAGSEDPASGRSNIMGIFIWNLQGEMTASITHEINQPLAGMVTNANASLRWLAGETPNLAEARDALRRIVRDGNRASDVIARTRALFKKTSAAKEPVDTNEIIQEVLAVTQNELQRNRVSLRTQFAKDLPMVTGDKIQLQQVILNLVINAIEAMHEVSEASRELCVSSEKVTDTSDEIEQEASSLPKARVLVVVGDSGPGLDSTQLQRVFETYYTTKSQGTGMGLAISRSIIEAHGGRLWAKRNTPRGALFKFTLPVLDLATTELLCILLN